MELRTCRNWTQEKLADKAIVSVRTVQNIERGRPTQRSTLAKLASALGVSARDLMLGVAQIVDSTVAQSFDDGQVSGGLEEHPGLFRA